MTRSRMPAAVVVAIALLLALSTAARAQSAIAGVVRDASGAILPGVTVEVSSDALIEKTRTVATDGEGQYKVIDLRPGVYVITFTLTGFQTIRREQLELPADFTATVNADLHVGGLEETVTVSGQSPVVDLQSTAKSEDITRSVIDSVPTGRTFQSIAQIVPGVVLSAPDVGGSHSMQQTSMSTHGMASTQSIIQLDGIQLNSMCGDGGVQFYTNTSISEEMVYQTTGANADVSGGGVRLNIVPKRGGNVSTGSIALMGTPSHSWQSDNLTQDLINRGLVATDKITRSYDFEGGVGGKFVKDKLWYFFSGRRISVDAPIADTFYPDGSQGIDDQYQQSGQVRLTYQLSPRNQLTAYVDRVSKYRGHAMVAGYDPVTAANIWVSPLYMATQAKWTSTVSNKMLVEVGYASHQDRRQVKYEPGVGQPYNSAAWLGTAEHDDTSLGTTYVAAPYENQTWPTRRYLTSSVSYVTGSHNFKFGAQSDWGSEGQEFNMNADLHQEYQNGTPFQVVVYNTPVTYYEVLHHDLGFYGQDSWTFKRLTFNYGARYEDWATGVPAENNGNGRFVPARQFGPQDLPPYKSINPRFGAVYDLLGDSKTALKFSVNRYEQAGTYGLASTYNPVLLQSAKLAWTDLNHDDIAEGSPGCTYMTPGCEINFAQLPANFGVAPAGCSMLATPGSIPCANSQMDPNLKRIYTMNYNVGVQHELLPRVSVSANWYHVDYYNLNLRENVLQTPADYAPQNVVSPLDGSVITIYNVSKAKVSQIQYLDTNAPNRKLWYNGYEVTFNARLPRGATLFGGVTTDKTLANTCDDPSNPNNLLYCDQTKSGIPFRTMVKLAGSYTLPLGIQLSGSLQSLPGPAAGTAALSGGTVTNAGNGATPTGLANAWLITPTTKYAANCLGPCTPGALVDPGMTVSSLSVPLAPPGVQSFDRINQLDLTVARWIALAGGKMRIQPELSLFNALNASPVYAFRSLNFGTASYLQPSSVLQGRIIRAGVQVKW
jgi:hypothetical protein